MLRRPPPCGFEQHPRHPAPNPDGPACRRRTGKQCQGHPAAHVPAPKEPDRS